ncbi:MAG: hypothetical protein PHV13_02075 [Candidatus ainarchaeum sp.]|nr:hypothetical protein [Candidatus ainarchaeum sp.]
MATDAGCRTKRQGPASRFHKGQVWSLDFTMGLLALLFVLALFMLLWNSIAMRWNSAGSQASMEASAFFASESLLATPGEPEGWEMLPHIDANVSALGLVNGRNELNRMKLDKLVAENATAYSTIKARLGLQRYELGMRITDLSDNVIYYEFGKFSGTLNNSLKFERFGILDGAPVLVHMEVWGG